MRSYMGWEKLTENSVLVNDTDYLLASHGYDNNKCYFDIATWWEKGHKVRLAYTPEKLKGLDYNNISSEERLLLAIFGELSKTVEVPADGFYKISSDPDDLVDTPYPDCKENLVLMGDWTYDMWYVELPVPPEGLVHPYDEKADSDLHMKKMQENLAKENEQKKADWDRFINLAKEKDGYIDKVFIGYEDENAPMGWRNWLHADDPAIDRDGKTYSDCVSFGPAIYKKDDDFRDKILIATGQLITAMSDISKVYTDEQIVTMIQRLRAGDKRRWSKCVDNIHTVAESYDHIGMLKSKWAHDEKIADKYSFILTKCLFDRPYWKHFNRPFRTMLRSLSSQPWFKTLPKANKILLASAMYNAVARLRSVVLFQELHVPEILLGNETRILFENLYMVFNTPVALTAGYEEFCGYDPEGNYVELPDEDSDEAAETTSDALPDIPEDYPKYDKYGDPITYEWDKTKKEWVDSGYHMEKELVDTGIEKDIENYTKSFMDTVKRFRHKQFKDLNTYMTELQIELGRLYYSVIKESDDKIAIQIAKDFGIYDCVMIPVFRVSNITDGFLYKDVQCTLDACEDIGLLSSDFEFFVHKADPMFVLRPN